MNRIIIVFLACTMAICAKSQELNFTVTVQAPTAINIFNTDVAIFKDLEKNLKEFVNNTRWTDEEYLINERITGNLTLTITEEVSANVFNAEIIIQSERPVFNSNYSSPIINLIDKNVSFQYNGLQPFRKTTNTFYDNLSSIISFYAYMTIGLDNESFSMNGGEKMFQYAKEIITSLPSAYVREDGWRNDGGTRRNRFWFIDNVLSPPLRQFRHAFYEYHRLGLDKAFDEPDKSRAVILSSLTSMGQADLELPNSYLLSIFGNAKKDEIVEIFKIADRGQKSKVSAIMVGIDPSKKEKYSALD